MGLVGGRRSISFMQKAEARAKELTTACEPPKPKKERPLLPNEEKQMMLPGLER
jgi:hypothetical protein